MTVTEKIVAGSERIEEMNQQYAVVNDGGRVRVLTFDRHTHKVGRAVYVRHVPSFMSFADFANLHMNQSINNNNGKPVPLGTWWLKHSHRLTYA